MSAGFIALAVATNNFGAGGITGPSDSHKRQLEEQTRNRRFWAEEQRQLAEKILQARIKENRRKNMKEQDFGI